MSRKGPVVFDIDEEAVDATAPNTNPADAPPPSDPFNDAAPATGQAMQTLAVLAARGPSRLARWFWGLLVALTGAVVSVAAWDFINGLIARNAALGWAITALFVAFGVVALIVVLRELAAIARLARIDRIQHQAHSAIADNDLPAAKQVVTRLTTIYAARPDLAWARDRLAERTPEAYDATDLLALAETELMAPLDAAATREIEVAARQVATVTALVPLALADVIGALTVNLRMMRRIAEIYGGRGGVLGAWRLARAVMTHLVATGAVAVGEDMLEPIIGGGLVGKLSRRFGEGVVNGALTARVGIAALEVCRPLPYRALQRPNARGVVSRALRGLFGGSKE